MFEKLNELCVSLPLWSVSRGVDGILMTFQDPLQCFPLEASQPDNEIKQPSKAPGATNHNNNNNIELNDGNHIHDVSPSTKHKRQKIRHHHHHHYEHHHHEEKELFPPSSGASPSSAFWRAWTCVVTFTEWRQSVSLHVLCDTPLVMSGIHARKLAAILLSFQETFSNPEHAFMELCHHNAHPSSSSHGPRLSPSKPPRGPFMMSSLPQVNNYASPLRFKMFDKPVSVESQLQFVRHKKSVNVVMAATQEIGM